MPYAERRDGKLTGRWISEFRGKFAKRAFTVKRDADDYETFVKLMGREPPSLTDDNANNTGRTYREVAELCKAAGGPKGKWLAGRDHSVIQRVDFCVSVIGDTDIGNVTRQTMQKITKALENRPGYGGKRKLSNATINRYLNAGGAVLSYAEQERLITKPKTPVLPEVSVSRGILKSYDQEDAILSCIRGWGMATEAFVIEVMVAAGVRRGEFFQLRPDQIENGCLNFQEDQTKNDEQRVVWIGEDRAAQLRAIVASGQMPKAWRMLRIFKKAAKACGYMDNLVLHSLRHTRNTRLRKEGVDIKTRMKMLGQKSIITSMRYDHVDMADQLEAAKKVEEARGDRRKKSDVVPFRPSKTA
jgi:integrase